MIRKMLKEEWRMHSNIYNAGHFASFPIMVFLITLTFSYLTLEYSTLDTSFLENFATALFAFIGLAVGSIGFSSRSAIKNVLGPVNLLVYSSRTLPISRKRLVLQYAIKDLIYYLGIVIIPVSLGIVLVAGLSVLPSLLIASAVFLSAMVVSIVFTRASKTRRVLPRWGYSSESFLPLACKSLLDLDRSAGGLFKVLFSFGIVTAFYWFVVLNFPIMDGLMNSPLLSFGLIAGILSLTVYNWLNRFDDLEDYAYLPLTKHELLKSKIQAFLALSMPLVVLSVLIGYVFYPVDLGVSLIAAVATTLYGLAIVVRLTGLKPNERFFDTWVFTKFCIANSIVVVPLLVFSVFYTGQIAVLLGVFLLVFAVSVALLNSFIRY